MRYLSTIEAEEAFAYERGRRDFYLVRDNTLWAHESHDWLVAAYTGTLLAHRTGDRYYSVTDGACIYRITSDASSESDRRASGSAIGLRVTQPTDPVASTGQ